MRKKFTRILFLKFVCLLLSLFTHSLNVRFLLTIVYFKYVNTNNNSLKLCLLLNVSKHLQVLYALMSNTRALLSCTVLSLQDSCFLYPSCKCCLSRLNQETSNKRATCARCGFSCDQQYVDYRYRLSVKVSRNQDIFCVTVFGGCLNPFFGITAGGLQEYTELEKSNGNHTIQQLLIKAVEDCFIGRCVVFGLKDSCDDVITCQQTPRPLVACQITSPSEAFTGLTVISYLKNLLKSNLCNSKSAYSDAYQSQQKDSQGSQKSFDYTLPSCAGINSQPSNGEFNFSSVWQSPGLCWSPGERNNDSLQQSRDYINTLSPKNEDGRSCHSSLEAFNEFKHVKVMPHELQDETHGCRKSMSSSCDMFEPLEHFDISTTCDPVYPGTSGEQYDAFFDKSLHSDENICLDLEDAPLSEDLLEFVKSKPQMSEIIDANKLRFSNSLNKQFEDQSSKLSKTSSAVQSDKKSLVSLMCNVKKQKCKKRNENDFLETNDFSSWIKEKRILTDLDVNLRPANASAFHLPKNSRLCFSNRKDPILQRKRLTRNRLSMAFCSLNHEKGKYFRHCVQPTVNSVNCKVKQERDGHVDLYNCSADMFAFCQNSMDMNHSDVTEVNESRDVNTSEHGVSGSLLFSPCLQSTPVSNQHSFRQKTGRRQKCVDSLLEVKGPKSDVKGLKENVQNKPDITKSEYTERFSDESDVLRKSNSSINVNEWSRDLFENSF